MSDDYFKWNGRFSKSSLDLIAKCPALFKHRIIDGNRDKPTAAMELGTAAHIAILEPDKWGTTYVCEPDFDRRTKMGKAAYAEWLESNPLRSKTIKKDAWQQVEGMAAAVADCATAQALLSPANRHGLTEAVVEWNDEVTGAPCKGRVDRFFPSAHEEYDSYVVDLKTTADASPAGFAKSCANFRYHVQAAMYLEGTGADRFYFVVVEKKAPYLTATYELSSDAIELGRQKMVEDLEHALACVGADSYPGYNQHAEVATLDLPAWAYR